MPETNVVRQIKRRLNVLVATTVLLYLGLGGLFLLTNHSAQKTEDALCTLRDDLQTRVASSRDFLKKHPHGIAGIPAVTIRQGLVNQQHTIDALSSLSC